LSKAPISTDGDLKRGVNLPAIIALGLGTAVGVSIFSVEAPATAVAGPAMLLSVLLAAVPMFIIAVTYAFMGSAAPVTGASYAWPSLYVHPLLGFLVAWLRIAGNVAVMVVLAQVLVHYLSIIAPLPVKPTMLAIFALILLPNLFGVGIAARVQVILMVALVAVLLGYAVWGAGSVQTVRLQPFFSHGVGSAFAAVPLLVGLFFGIESATEIGEEVKGGGLVIPLGIALSIASAVVLYLVIAFVTLGVLGGPAVAASSAPLLTAAQHFMGPFAKPVIVAAATLSLAKSLNGSYLVFSRILLAMGRAGALPSLFARLHPKWGTPYVALITVFLACTAGLLLPSSLTFLFLAVNLPILFKYGSVCLSALRMLKLRPDLYAAAQFKFSLTTTRLWAYAGIACAGVVMLLGFGTDWRPYALLAVWAMIGLGLNAVRSRTR
jgi:APA family basic amino acid/polyamine antiporter